MLGKLWCRLGFHNLEKEPSQKDNVKGTGLHWIFFSEGIQKGKAKCLRQGCDFETKVYRQGWVGISCPEPKWQKLDNPNKEAYIDSLHGVFQA